jgi:Family of unknown function (DUF6152)
VKRVMWASSIVGVAAVAVFATRLSAAAHHSSAAFYDDTKKVEAVGMVAKFQFRNPHSFLFIDGQENGEPVEWEIEMGAAVTMARSGWTPETIKAGDPIKAVGQPSRAPGTHGMCCAQLTRPDGSPIRAR